MKKFFNIQKIGKKYPKEQFADAKKLQNSWLFSPKSPIFFDNFEISAKLQSLQNSRNY